MFRNTYLELYKTSAASQQNLPVLINHFNQIYNTLGCVLQDLQFQVGRILVQINNNQSNHSLEKDINSCQYTKNINNPKEVDKNIIKIQESLPEKFVPKPEEQINSLKRKPNPIVKVEAADTRKSRNGEDWGIMPHSTNKQALITEKVRHIARGNIGADSFDSLFDPQKSNKKSPMQMQPNTRSKVGQIGDQARNSQQMPLQNTYEDFLDRLFRDQESKKNW